MQAQPIARPGVTRRHRSLGVTLIELMVTLTIGAIMLTLAAPGFQTFIRTTHVRTVTNELAATFNLARSEAIKRGWPVTVCKSSDVLANSLACSTSASWKDGWLIFVDADQDGVVDADDTPIRVGRPDTGRASISGDTNYANYVTYLPSGSSRGNDGLSNGTITICMEGIQRELIINNTGRLSIDTGTC
jgi:type IV fimbrial biogenesis protein FimT